MSKIRRLVYSFIERKIWLDRKSLFDEWYITTPRLTTPN